MKKLSLLIALALILSIGGVYATWSYAGAAAEGSHKHFGIDLADVTQDVAEGVITGITTDMDIELDQADGSYNAKAVITGLMSFAFKPNAGASDDVLANGITLQWTLEQSATPMQYEGVDVFAVDSTPVSLGNGIPITAENAPADSPTALEPGKDLTSYIGGFYVKIIPSDVEDKLTVNLNLPTYADYQAFQTGSLSSGLVGITVSKAP